MTKQHIRTAVITGGAQGLGLACAEQLALQSSLQQTAENPMWRLILLDIDDVKLQQAKSQLERYHCQVEIYPLDLLDTEDLLAWLAGYCLAESPLDLLINNAGITHRSSANYTDMAVFEKVMQLNWQVPVQLTQSLLPALQAAQGSVVVLGSMA